MIKDKKILKIVNQYHAKAWTESDMNSLCQQVYRMPNLSFDPEYGMCILKEHSKEWLVLSETKLKPIRGDKKR